MISTINITNNSNNNLYIFLLYYNDLQQIAILKPKKCLLKNYIIKNSKKIITIFNLI